MSIYTRNECSIEGCHQPARTKGWVRGRKIYGNKCWRCHRNRIAGDTEHGFTLAGIPNPKCERCGWCEGPCDRHKKVPELGYVRENIVVLCPNCHRLETLGLIEL